jgi:serine/threonine protein kinase
LHHQGFAHRDVKPANLLVNSDGNVVMADLGGASALDRNDMVKSKYVSGTPGYIAPEAMSLLRTYIARWSPSNKHTRYAGAPADVFSAGATIFELLTGRVPQPRRRKQRWAAKLAGAFTSRQQQQQPTVGSKVPFPSDLGLSPEAVQLVSSMLERRPERRPTLEQIRSHAWFADFDWAAFKAGSMASPPWALSAAEQFAGVPS